MLERLARVGGRFVATTSSNARALPAGELAALAARWFPEVEAIDDPVAAVERARQDPPVLVDGLSLPPLGFGRARGAARRVTKLGEQLTVVAFGAFVIIAIVGAAFGVGYLVGKLLL